MSSQPKKRGWRWLKQGARMAIVLGTMAFLLLAVLGILPSTWLKNWDESYYDARLRWTMPQTTAAKIVIVDVDEKSLAELGRWPWPRDKMARLVEAIFQQQKALALGIDMVFAEPDTSSGLPVLERLAQGPLATAPLFMTQMPKFREELDYDGQFAQMLKRYPVALGYYFTSDREGRRSGQLPSPVMQTQALQGRRIGFTTWDGYGANLPLFAQAAPTAGFFNSLVSADGVVRTIPLLAEYDGQYYESLALAMLRMVSGWPAVQPGFPAEGWVGRNYNHLASVDLHFKNGALMALPVDERGATFVPYRGNGGPKGGAFTYYSASDVLQGRLPEGSFKNKLVLLGTSTPSLLDLRTTPVGVAYPGVEVQANVLSGFLEGNVPVRPDYALGYEVTVLLVLGVILALALPWLGTTGAGVLCAGLFLLTTGLNFWAYRSGHLVLPIASAWVLLALAFVLNAAYSYFVAHRARRNLTRLFGCYVPSELVEVMLDDAQHFSMMAQNKELTVMFCDLRGFTKLAEGKDPLQVQTLLNRIFEGLTEVIRANGGTIDKYMGDCIMAFWGAPIESSEHPQLALRAALQMQEVLHEVDAQLRAEGLLGADQAVLRAGLALTTGVMCVGNMGTSLRQAYTVIGDAVNLCARLERLSRVYEVDLIVSEGTRNANKDWAWQELDTVQVKGKSTPERIFTPVGLKATLSEEKRNELKAWKLFLRAYRAGQWEDSELYLFNIMRGDQAKRPLYQLYAERVRLLRDADPSNWQGIAMMGEK